MVKEMLEIVCSTNLPNVKLESIFPGDIEDPTSQEVVIYEETYPYPAEYQPTDYYPQHYNYQYHQRPGTQVDRQDAQDRVFLGGLGILVSDSGISLRAVMWAKMYGADRINVKSTDFENL